MTTDSRRVLRFGVAGFGMAGNAMIKHLAAHPDVEIVAGADRQEELRDAFARDFRAEVYDDVQALCDDPSVDVVYVATPHQFHNQHITMAAEAGKHVIVEKPLSLALEDCDRVIDVVDRTGIKLIVGHTESYAPAVKLMRQIVASGELGKLGMINSWNYNDFLYRPRRPEELDTSLGGGILFNQTPHQVDVVRLIGGGMVRSVRAMTGVWDSNRPTEGACLAFMEFEDGAAASIVYNGYDHFDTRELHGWIPADKRKPDDAYGQTRRALAEVKDQAEEARLRVTKYAYGLGGGFPIGPSQPHFGITVVSCEHGDMRPWGDGVAVYSDDGRREIPCPSGRGLPARGDVIDELYNAVVHDRPLVHDARWAKATLEVCLGILRSSRERREVMLEHQVPLNE